MNSILEIENLKVKIKIGDGIIYPIRDVSFDLKKGETLGIVGESGSGKSLTARSIMGILPVRNAKIMSGEIKYKGVNITNLAQKQYTKFRGNEICMIFQDPMTSLNPVFTVGQQLREPLINHKKKMSVKDMNEIIINALNSVSLTRAAELLNEYPHQLSGGMCQRIMIAMALICEPQILIADEPTTALDVTIQSQVLELMKEIKIENDMSMLFITHDLDVIAEMCDRVAVMYAGEIMEIAKIVELFDYPLHPYTKGLMASLPSNNKRKEKLYSIRGQISSIKEIQPGCVFASRCDYAIDQCFQQTPPMYNRNDHISRCWLHFINGGD